MTATTAPRDHHVPEGLRDRFALALVKFMRFFADTFFAHRYGHRAVVLETVAAVPGMVGGTLQHLRALRRMTSDQGWIRTLLNEAENVLTDAARFSLFRRKLLEHVEGIVAASVKPLEKINDIRIVQMDGLNQGNGGGGSPTDEVINSALRYRVQAPLIDSLKKAAE